MNQKKGPWQWFIEVLQFFSMAGIAAILLQIGEYKERFKTLCEGVKELKLTIAANAEENSIEHMKIKNSIIEHTGKPVK